MSSFALPDALFFTGIGWAAETHAVCVLDAAGKVAAEFTIEHSAGGISVLLRRLARYGAAGGMPVAIERPDGRLAGLLLEAGHPVVPVKPNAIKTWRDGEVLSGAKSDAGDAVVIAEYLRLRAQAIGALPDVEPRDTTPSSAAEQRAAAKALQATERKLERLGQRVEAMHVRMAGHDPADYLGLGRLHDELRDLEAEVAELEDAWLELSEQAG